MSQTVKDLAEHAFDQPTEHEMRQHTGGRLKAQLGLAKPPPQGGLDWVGSAVIVSGLECVIGHGV
jgi:hypothetical protein